jgi:hypothetical protein
MEEAATLFSAFGLFAPANPDAPEVAEHAAKLLRILGHQDKEQSMIRFKVDDDVTIVDSDVLGDPALGRVGIVDEVDEAAGLITVRGIEPRAKELELGCRAFWPHQLASL